MITPTKVKVEFLPKRICTKWQDTLLIMVSPVLVRFIKNNERIHQGKWRFVVVLEPTEGSNTFDNRKCK